MRHQTEASGVGLKLPSTSSAQTLARGSQVCLAKAVSIFSVQSNRVAIIIHILRLIYPYFFALCVALGRLPVKGSWGTKITALVGDILALG